MIVQLDVQFYQRELQQDCPELKKTFRLSCLVEYVKLHFHWNSLIWITVEMRSSLGTGTAMLKSKPTKTRYSFTSLCIEFVSWNAAVFSCLIGVLAIQIAWIIPRICNSDYANRMIEHLNGWASFVGRSASTVYAVNRAP